MSGLDRYMYFGAHTNEFSSTFMTRGNLSVLKCVRNDSGRIQHWHHLHNVTTTPQPGLADDKRATGQNSAGVFMSELLQPYDLHSLFAPDVYDSGNHFRNKNASIVSVKTAKKIWLTDVNGRSSLIRQKILYWHHFMLLDFSKTIVKKHNSELFKFLSIIRQIVS